MYKLFRPKSSGNNKCKVMKTNPNVITVWTKKILNLQFFFNVIHTNKPSVPYSGSDTPAALHTSIILLTPVPQLSKNPVV